MRLESVEISNYRQYKDVFFDFCTKGSYDVHIIWGKNGMGKTNLLNAISWCLYGTGQSKVCSANKQVDFFCFKGNLPAGNYFSYG